MTKPLYVIKKKVVWGTFAASVIQFFILAIVKWIFLYQGFKLDKNNEFLLQIFMNQTEVHMPDFLDPEIQKYIAETWKSFAYVQAFEYLIVTMMVIVVAVCSVVTVKSLNSPIVEPGEVNNNSNNRRATIMVLLLSLAFVVLNGFWLAISAYYYSVFLSSYSVKIANAMQLIVVGMIMINSTINPLIYITRNSALNQYTKEFILTILRNILQIFQSLGKIVPIPRVFNRD